MKKSIKLSIEEDILFEAKKQIPNLSEYFEDCLKMSLGFESNLPEEIKEFEIRQITNKIHDLMIQRKFMAQSMTSEKKREKRLNHTKDLAWCSIWSSYVDYKTYSFDDMDRAEDILDKDEEELVRIMDVLYKEHYRDDLYYRIWNNVLKECDEWINDYASSD